MSLKAKILKDTIINKKRDIRQVTTQFYKNKDKLIDVDELDDLLDQMYEKGTSKHDNFKYTLVRVMNGGNWMSFKDLDTLEDYYSGKVKDDSKFYEFMQVQITCVFS
jgi:hypothetical protein